MVRKLAAWHEREREIERNETLAAAAVAGPRAEVVLPSIGRGHAPEKVAHMDLDLAFPRRHLNI